MYEENCSDLASLEDSARTFLNSALGTGLINIVGPTTGVALGETVGYEPLRATQYEERSHSS